MKIKKQIPVIAALCVAAAVVGGCTTDNKKYDELNSKLDYNYSQIVLKITDEFDTDSVLVSEYTMKSVESGMKVSYSVERFAEVSLDSAADEKTTLVGEAVVAGGNVVYVSGEEVPLSGLIAGTGLDFKNDYFDNIDLTDVYLKADVKDPGGFMGSSLKCKDMRVEATFLDVFYEIKITYLAQSGNRVEYLYTFSI